MRSARQGPAGSAVRTPYRTTAIDGVTHPFAFSPRSLHHTVLRVAPAEQEMAKFVRHHESSNTPSTPSPSHPAKPGRRCGAACHSAGGRRTRGTLPQRRSGKPRAVAPGDPHTGRAIHQDGSGGGLSSTADAGYGISLFQNCELPGTSLIGPGSHGGSAGAVFVARGPFYGATGKKVRPSGLQLHRDW